MQQFVFSAAFLVFLLAMLCLQNWGVDMTLFIIMILLTPQTDLTRLRNRHNEQNEQKHPVMVDSEIFHILILML